MEYIWTICLIIGGAMYFSGRRRHDNYLLQVSGCAFGVMLILAGAMGSIVHPENWFMIGCLLVIMALGLIIATVARFISELRQRNH
jgi:hypothetical protein